MTTDIQKFKDTIPDVEELSNEVLKNQKRIIKYFWEGVIKNLSRQTYLGRFEFEFSIPYHISSIDNFKELSSPYIDAFEVRGYHTRFFSNSLIIISMPKNSRKKNKKNRK